MPAIRYMNSGVPDVASHRSRLHRVDVLSKLGERISVNWLGFICEYATHHIGGRAGKILALQVTSDDGYQGSRWIKVEAIEVVAGWLVELYDEPTIQYGVYGVVNAEGWPIIKPKITPPPKPRLVATVIPLKRKTG